MNPYELPADDSDILSEPVSPVEDTPSHTVVGPNGEQIALPAELNDALAIHTGRNKSSMPQQFLAVSGMLDFYSNFTNFHVDSPLTLAMAEILDKMSNGELEHLYRFHEAERKILTTTAVRIYQDILLQIIDQMTEYFGDYKTEIINYMTNFLEVSEFVRQRAVAEYIDLAEKLGKEVDQELIEHGKFTHSDWMRRAAMFGPRALTEDER